MLKNVIFIQKYFYIQTCLYFEKNLSQLHAEKIFLNEKKNQQTIKKEKYLLARK